MLCLRREIQKLLRYGGVDINEKESHGWAIITSTSKLNINETTSKATFWVNNHLLRWAERFGFDWILNSNISMFLFFAVYEIYKKKYSLSTVYSGVKFLFFFSVKLPTPFIQNKMTAVGLGQQRSQAVGLGFESLSCQIFLRFPLSIFWCPKLVKHWRVPLRCFSALWDKKFRRKILILPPFLIKLFWYPESMQQ